MKMNYGLSEKVYAQIKEIIKRFNKYTFKIFGSRARGDYKDYSDIDIAVYEDVNETDRYKILNEFDLLDIPYSIDLVFVNKEVKKELLDSIQEDGKEF